LTVVGSGNGFRYLQWRRKAKGRTKIDVTEEYQREEKKKKKKVHFCEGAGRKNVNNGP